MDAALFQIVTDRLGADRDEPWALLALAACEGAGSLAAVLGGEPRGSRAAPAESAVERAPLGAYLRSITVEGFRGIGPRVTLELTPGPGLTLVVGRNGSGKSSFAEGLEILLTGSNWRWAHRSRVWVEGWRNLHHAEQAQVSADFAIDGEKGATTVTRTWETENIESSQVVVMRPSRRKADFASLGWSSALEAYRPFLSYNELGSMFDEGPTKLHDRLSAILGLGELDLASELLRDVRLEREKALTSAKKNLASLLVRLGAIDDDRARRAVAALAGRKWNLDAAGETIDRSASAVESRGAMATLRALAALRTPSPEAAADASVRLRAAADRLDAMLGTAPSDAGQLASLLRQALAHHDRHGDGNCPVCGKRNALSATWRARTETAAEQLERTAADWRDARAAGESALTDGMRLLSDPPTLLGDAAAVEIDVAGLRDAWQALAAVPPARDLRTLANHLEESVVRVADAAERVRADASAELERREDVWRPVALDLAAWIGAARAADAGAEPVADLKAAERWLKETSGAIRTQRFQPIADAVVQNWKALRQQSSVELGRVALAGTGTQRRVEMDVQIDGVPGAALGVMSQGELNSIALGLFLPRATLPESPFRFVVIDDPVQSMDPARVDGLANVLAHAARDRQVVVFTHDDRLPEAVRRLNLSAHVFAVTRGPESEVEVTEAWNPVRQHLDDAKALARTEHLPPGVAGHVVPGYCRSAIEAACIEVARRRLIGRGVPHAEVEREIESLTTLTLHLALALFDDPARGGDVAARLREWGDWAESAVSFANRGSHAGYRGSLDDLIRDTERVCRTIRERSK